MKFLDFLFYPANQYRHCWRCGNILPPGQYACPKCGDDQSDKPMTRRGWIFFAFVVVVFIAFNKFKPRTATRKKDAAQ